MVDSTASAVFKGFLAERPKSAVSKTPSTRRPRCTPTSTLSAPSFSTADDLLPEKHASARRRTTQGKIVGHANTLGEPIWDVAATPAEGPCLGAAAIKAVGRFMSVMQRLRERAESASVGDLLADLLRESGYTQALEAERTIEAQGRLENLEELVDVAREYDATAEEPSVEEFLQQIADRDALKDEAGVVTLMTCHARQPESSSSSKRRDRGARRRGRGRRTFDARREAACGAAARPRRDRHAMPLAPRDLPSVCRRADVLIAAVGVPKLITAEMVGAGRP